MAVGTDIFYPSSQNTDTTRTLTTTIRKHFKDVEPEMLRQHRLTAMLEQEGRLEFNAGGAGFDWPLQYRLHDIQDNNGTDPRNFVAQELWKIANLEYRGYQVTDAVSKKEKLAAQGPEGIIKVASKIVDRLKQSLKEGFARELYVDGNTAANAKRIHGFESFCGASVAVSSPKYDTYNWGTTGTVPTNTARSIDGITNGDPIVVPSDTYAGLSTALGNYGGSQISGAWPLGVADPQYDFYTPLLLNTQALFFGATAGWQNNAREILSFGIINSQRNASLDDQMDFVLMDRLLYYQARNLLTDAERILVTNKTGLRAFGFKNTFELDGIECSWEYGIPMTPQSTSTSTTLQPSAYGFNVKNMTLYSMQDSLFKVEGPEYDIDTQHDKVVVDYLGNVKFESPRRAVKWAPYGA